ncbi:MAG: nucleotidyl transferase AbiEii/AbiGii toxin family protein [Culturomica sp.]|jgi:hypothetical protein|nr:nucleotidyl transferase AbiEii/AbiGii toxin family protein [Culturomica sp.]
MYPDILSKEQVELLPLMRQFRREFYLVGGTAIALQLGHRRSVDFDLFKLSKINTTRTLNKLDAAKLSYIVTRRVSEQINLVLNHVKLTFFQYPYVVEANVVFENVFRMPDLLTLAAMKAYALGRRSKWKDYVDLYFLLRDHYTLDHIAQKADLLFGQMFSGKLFRSQLAFHKDIDYSEPVEYLHGFEVSEQEIKTFLIDKALQEI